jgi:hypothetical protein
LRAFNNNFFRASLTIHYIHAPLRVNSHCFWSNLESHFWLVKVFRFRNSKYFTCLESPRFLNKSAFSDTSDMYTSSDCWPWLGGRSIGPPKTKLSNRSSLVTYLPLSLNWNNQVFTICRIIASSPCCARLSAKYNRLHCNHELSMHKVLLSRISHCLLTSLFLFLRLLIANIIIFSRLVGLCLPEFFENKSPVLFLDSFSENKSQRYFFKIPSMKRDFFESQLWCHNVMSIMSLLIYFFASQYAKRWQ